MSTLLFAAIGGSWGKTGIAFSANGLVAIEGLGKHGEGWVVDSSTKTKDQMESGFLLDVVVAQGSSIFQLLSSENQTLLIRRDSFLVLDLSLDIVNSIAWFDIKSDGLTRKGLHEDLHGQLDEVIINSTEATEASNKAILIGAVAGEDGVSSAPDEADAVSYKLY